MIGIFDSGIGGLSVLREMQRRIPNNDFLYLGDTAGGPYEDKSPELVAGRVVSGLSYLADSGAGLLVVADHGSACVVSDIRHRFSVPIFDILRNGVIPGVKARNARALGIMAPPIIEDTGAYTTALQKAFPETRIYSAAAPLLSSLIDAGWIKKPETVMIVKKYLHFFKLRQIDTLVLGSNHYSVLASVIQRKIGKRVTVLNAAPVLTQEVRDFAVAHEKGTGRPAKTDTCRVVVSDLTSGMTKRARMFYGKNIHLELLP